MGLKKKFLKDSCGFTARESLLTRRNVMKKNCSFNQITFRVADTFANLRILLLSTKNLYQNLGDNAYYVF